MIWRRDRHAARWDNIDRSPANLSRGRLGEDLAARYLQTMNYRIVAKNFTAPIGYSLKGRRISGEIDLIAYDESRLPFTLCFIEVKTRTSVSIARPETAVDLRKQRHISKTARAYRRIMNVSEEPYRYDVIALVLPREGPEEILLLRGFFEEQRFAKRNSYAESV
jgi:putative endonuclease